jgi:CheY-like chemotaxis protein
MSERVRVLVVDEDPDVLAITREFLEHEDDTLDVTTVQSAAGAVDRTAADSGAVDVVVTDLSMPEMSGVELASAVHEHAPDIPCVLYTAHDRETVEDEFDTTLSGLVRKRTGTEQYAELASLVRDLAE